MVKFFSTPKTMLAFQEIRLGTISLRVKQAQHKPSILVLIGSVKREQFENMH